MHTTTVKECSAPSLRSIILEILAWLELSQFVSRIHTRHKILSQLGPLKSLGHIIMVLCQPILNVEMEYLSEVSSFCIKENSLLDYVVATGLEVNEL